MELIKTFDEYQKFTFTTATNKNNPRWEDYVFEGLGSEIGEVLGKLKRTLRGDYSMSVKVRKEVAMELGDVVWYLMQILALYNREPSHYIIDDIEKYNQRFSLNINDDLVHQNTLILYSTSAHLIGMRTRREKIYFTQIRHMFEQILNQVALIASQMEIKMIDVINWNVTKLSERKKAGTIKGTGDGIKGKKRKTTNKRKKK